MRRRSKTRRQLLRDAGAAGAVALWPCPTIGQTPPRIVIVGGGFAGASCARALRRIDAKLAVTLVEARRIYTAPPLSSGVFGGIRRLADQQFGYDGVAAAGVTVAIAKATAIDPQTRTVTPATGGKLTYEKLVLAPGVDMRFDAIPGYDEAASAQAPHAWTTDGAQYNALHRQLEAMEDGGLVAIAAPVEPARCPPGPYERASMIAFYLKARKPRSKVVILDSKDGFIMQHLFRHAWRRLYPGLIEWKSISTGDNIASIDTAAKKIETDFDSYHYGVANVIPPQVAGKIAAAAGVADHTGWCPIDPVTFESVLQRDIHVIGDAALAGAMPKSAFAAAEEGGLCAAAIVSILAGKPPVAAKLFSTCYSLIAPDYAISTTTVHQAVNGEYADVPGADAVSPLAAPPRIRTEEVRRAEAWFGTATAGIFG